MRLFTPRGLRLIGYLATFAAGAVAHEYFAGERMWQYHAEQAAERVAYVEQAYTQQAVDAVRGIDRVQIAQAKAVAPQLTQDQRDAKRQRDMQRTAHAMRKMQANRSR